MVGFTPSIKRLEVSGRDQFIQGVTLAKEGKLQEALIAFESAVQADPDMVDAHMAAGNILFRRRQYADAIVHYRTAMELDPLMSTAPLKAGDTYLRQDKLDEALECFRTAIDLEPNSTTATYAHMGIAQIYLKQENFANAIDHCRKALRLNPQMMMPRLMASSAYKRQGDLDEAISELRTALNINNKLPVSYLQLGSLYLEQKNYTDARKAFESVIELEPKMLDVTYGAKLGLVFTAIEMNNLQTAADLLREIPENKRYASRKHKLFGDLYTRQGLPKEAAEEYRAAILLGSPDGTIPNDLEQFDDLNIQDERWEEILANYRSSATSMLQTPGIN